MNSKDKPMLSGQALINDYLTVLVSVATVEHANYQAQHSEESALDYLNNAASGSFLDPSNIPTDSQSTITRASLDAHIKKAQALQIESASAVQVAAILEQDQKDYKGKKVRVDVLNKNKKPVENLWFDKYKGYQKGNYNRSSVSGYIENVYLDKNVLILKPTRTSRLVTPNLQNLIVYIINPDDLSPLVEIIII
jgi:hypothetical protein